MITETIQEKASRSLHKRELKPILTKQMKQDQPDFRFLTFATSAYYFQRIRLFRDRHLKEMLHIVYSFTDHTMQASVSSRLNPVHTLNPIYNTGLINPHVDLAALKNGISAVAGDTPYICDGTIDGVRELVRTVVGDFRNTGTRFLDQRLAALESSRLINAGLDFIDEWDFDNTMLGNELQLQLRKAKFKIERVRQPQLNDLRARLEAIARISGEDKQAIPRLAFDLMELYCNRRIAAY